jgi:hypothetical protein
MKTINPTFTYTEPKSPITDFFDKWLESVAAESKGSLFQIEMQITTSKIRHMSKRRQKIALRKRPVIKFHNVYLKDISDNLTN